MFFQTACTLGWMSSSCTAGFFQTVFLGLYRGTLVSSGEVHLQLMFSEVCVSLDLPAELQAQSISWCMVWDAERRTRSKACLFGDKQLFTTLLFGCSVKKKHRCPTRSSRTDLKPPKHSSHQFEWNQTCREFRKPLKNPQNCNSPWH